MRITQLRNLIFCNRWSFRIISVRPSQGVANSGDLIHFIGTIKNDGFRLGSVYIRLTIADPYDQSDIIFDSDRDLGYSEKKQNLI
jgi:hypothetical protein